MAASSTTRRGNGDGWGAGHGGGPAKGEGQHNPLTLFERGNKVAAGRHDMSRAKQAELAMNHLLDLAFGAEKEETQKSAIDSFLNRVNGMPVAKTESLVTQMPLTQEQRETARRNVIKRGSSE